MLLFLWVLSICTNINILDISILDIKNTISQGGLSRYLTLRYNKGMAHEDHVSSILAQWAAERPDAEISNLL